jgi:type III secretion protein J
MRWHITILLLASLILGCRTEVQHGLDEKQANELQSLLFDHGFDVRKVKEPGKKPTWALDVPAAQAQNATQV